MAKWSNEKMADLTRKLADTAIEQNELYQAALRDAKEAEAYAEELEAKLAKTVEALNYFLLRDPDKISSWEYNRDQAEQLARTTLAELTGGKNA